MFNLFKKTPKGTSVTLQLSGLHCVSCSLNVDDELEDLPGVISSTTSYAKQQSIVTYDPQKVKVKDFKSTIESLGYKVIS